MSSATTRICPECGAENAGIALFCAECGASLAGARTTPQPEYQDDRSQTTAAYTPVNTATTYRPSDPYQAPPIGDTGQPVTSSSVTTTQQTYLPQQPIRRQPAESKRGLVLGLLAGILMLLVIGFFIWSTLMTEGARDSILGIFGA